MRYLIFILLSCNIFAEKVPFHKVVMPSDETVVIAAPHDRFVLLQVCASHNGFVLNTAERIDASLFRQDRCHNFPDGAVSIDPNTPFSIEFTYPGPVFIAGYFEKADCPLRADITGDCKVNIEDLVILASEWLRVT